MEPPGEDELHNVLEFSGRRIIHYWVPHGDGWARVDTTTLFLTH